eukprot:362765-Chlamydomonas_euryale.AAC.1
MEAEAAASMVGAVSNTFMVAGLVLVMLTASSNAQLLNAVPAGAVGLLLSSPSPSELTSAMTTAAKAVPPNVGVVFEPTAVLRAGGDIDGLTPSQQHALRGSRACTAEKKETLFAPPRTYHLERGPSSLRAGLHSTAVRY